MTPCRQIVTSLPFFRFMANLQPSRRRIPEAWFIKLTFLLIVTFYLTDPENRTKESLAISIALSKGTMVKFVKNDDYLQKNTDINKFKEVYPLNGIFSKTKYVLVLPHYISSF